MTLSDIIIYRSADDLMQVLQQPEAANQLNKLDEYGYTPLIETLIANDTEKAKLILEQDVDVNLADITGRSALHWAAENSNIEIAKALLERGAKADAFSFAAEPVITKPLLRHQGEFVDLLRQHNASITFAHDYINAKLIGHQFELIGSVDIASPSKVFTEVDYEGFYFEFSLDLVANLLSDYLNNYAARDVRDWFGPVAEISEALYNASQIIKYDHYLVDIDQHRERIDLLFTRDPLIIPISQEGHAITIVKYQNLLAVCDRAERSAYDDVITVYYMNRPSKLNADYLRHWVYKKQILELLYRSLPAELGLQPIAEIPLHAQIMGNCSWANVEAVIPTLYFMQRVHERDNDLGKEELISDALEIFSRWQQWSRERALTFCVDAFEHADPSRKASLAAMLAGVLFQTCSADNPDHIERAKKIIPVLKTPGYEYILESYIKTYVQMKKTKAGENLQKLLQAYDLEEI